MGVSHREVDRAGAKQQQEHRLAHHLPGHVAQGTPLACAEFVGPFVAQALRGRNGVQARRCFGVHAVSPAAVNLRLAGVIVRV